MPRVLAATTFILLILLLINCQPTPDVVTSGCELFPEPGGHEQLYQWVFNQLIVESRPVYRQWDLYPVPEGSPVSKMVRLGLPVHGRWATTYVNPPAFGPLSKAAAENNPDVSLTLPAGSFLVKENYKSTSQQGQPVVISPENSELEVLTVMYKPTEEQRTEFGFECATSQTDFNGDPKTGCLGGEWFYAFYKIDATGEGESQTIACSSDNLGKWFNTQVNRSDGSFCVHCHSAGFKTDYARIIYDDLRSPQEPNDNRPVVPPLSAAPCTADLSPNLPGDVPVRPLSVFEKDGGQATKEMFDCFSWRAFVALSWPADPENPGQPDRSANILKPPPDSQSVWQSYRPVYSTFQAGNVDWNPGSFSARPAIDRPGCSTDSDMMVLALQSKAQDVIDEEGQAFAGTFGNLMDRNTNLVHYGVLINETEYDYIVNNNAAQTPNLTPGGPTNLPKVSFPDGSIEVKSGWKVLCPQPGESAEGCMPVDDPNDYFTTTALLYDPAEATCGEPTLVGLVGFHIAYKTFWAPQWVWATFSHNTNAPTAGNAEELKREDYSFYDPQRQPPDLPETPPCSVAPFLITPRGCPNVVINRFEDRPGGLPPFLPPPNEPNQITRLVPSDGAADKMNALFQGALQGSPLENYILVDSQWPLYGQRGTPSAPDPNPRPCKPAESGQTLPAENCFVIVPQFLRNPVVESYMTTYSNGDPQQFSNRGCLNCHFLGAQGSYVWLDAAASQIPVSHP